MAKKTVLAARNAAQYQLIQLMSEELILVSAHLVCDYSFDQIFRRECISDARETN